MCDSHFAAQEASPGVQTNERGMATCKVSCNKELHDYEECVQTIKMLQNLTSSTSLQNAKTKILEILEVVRQQEMQLASKISEVEDLKAKMLQQAKVAKEAEEALKADVRELREGNEVLIRKYKRVLTLAHENAKLRQRDKQDIRQSVLNTFDQLPIRQRQFTF